MWVRLSTGDDATPCDNVFAPAGEGGAKTLSYADLPAPGSEAAPARRGYAFAGWYTDPSCADDTLVDADYTFDESSKTLYAKWVPGPTTFSVVVWVEDGSGGPQHRDADQSDLSKYTAYGSWEPSGTTGQSATVAKAAGNDYAIKVLAGDDTVGGATTRWAAPSSPSRPPTPRITATTCAPISQRPLPRWLRTARRR